MASTTFSGPVTSTNGFIGNVLAPSAAAVDGGNIDVTKTIAVIEEEGTYTLPDGVEGQVLYITAGAAIANATGVFVNITHGRTNSNAASYPISEGAVTAWLPFVAVAGMYPTTSGPLVFVNGYWSLPHSNVD
tara:strand:- start:7948 stop:8343 length:396 start_codon:yes stop_codon:yes gene_type:complete